MVIMNNNKIILGKEIELVEIIIVVRNFNWNVYFIVFNRLSLIKLCFVGDFISIN